VTQEAKPLIRIKMKIGSVEFEVECREDQIKDVVDKVLSSVTEHSGKREGAPKTIENPPRAETCRGIIQNMWREGWFSTHRSLSEVHEEMMRRGFHFDRSAVSHVLKDLVMEGILSRDGRARNYLYIQKRPPSAG